MFVANALDFFEVDVARARALDEVVFSGYLEGLRKAGWQGNPELVRFGYTAAMSIRRCLGTLPLNVGLMLDERDHAYLEQEFGAPIDILAEQWGPLEEVFLGYTAEARSLLHRLW